MANRTNYQLVAWMSHRLCSFNTEISSQ